jgi:hypothetical protein
MRELFLILHFIGLAMAVGTGFANLFLGYAASKLEPAERGSFMSKTTILTRMGQIGLGVLILSGFYLINPYWATLSQMPFFIAKLALVALQVILVTILSLRVKKAMREKAPALLAKLRPLAMSVFFVGITIVVLAVLAFH